MVGSTADAVLQAASDDGAGTQGRSGLAGALLGSTAESLLHPLDCDTLVVRGA